MPLLDVTEVLSDPDFQTTALACIRNAQSVSSGGIASNATTTTPFAGVVVSDRGNVLQRMGDAEYVTGSILIYTKFVLSVGATNQTADVVTWNGRSFTVTDINDYSGYGAGFVCAHCAPLALSGS